MRVIALSTLRDFRENPDYKDAEHPLRAWYSEAMAATWLLRISAIPDTHFSLIADSVSA